jgi:hypothetical protein
MMTGVMGFQLCFILVVLPAVGRDRETRARPSTRGTTQHAARTQPVATLEGA